MAKAWQVFFVFVFVDQNNDAVESIEGRLEINSWSQSIHSNGHLGDKQAKKYKFGVIWKDKENIVDLKGPLEKNAWLQWQPKCSCYCNKVTTINVTSFLSNLYYVTSEVQIDIKDRHGTNNPVYDIRNLCISLTNIRYQFEEHFNNEIQTIFNSQCALLFLGTTSKLQGAI